ncbi:hypothetical protein [Alienimonas californiensis]|uniref:Uncharacterized protein n=1 Tax=Alienimonas californiensis TaxID=2527989 RepID=A0A517PAR2_9PLAN|nr:hypothetical protein [Alienimonas californiensis]QDT16441.1 hypothetical protein CA12_25430 [Alienimonas californiensis]
MLSTFLRTASVTLAMFVASAWVVGGSSAELDSVEFDSGEFDEPAVLADVVRRLAEREGPPRGTLRWTTTHYVDPASLGEGSMVRGVEEGTSVDTPSGWRTESTMTEQFLLEDRGSTARGGPVDDPDGTVGTLYVAGAERPVRFIKRPGRATAPPDPYTLMLGGSDASATLSQWLADRLDAPPQSAAGPSGLRYVGVRERNGVTLDVLEAEASDRTGLPADFRAVWTIALARGRDSLPVRAELWVRSESEAYRVESVALFEITQTPDGRWFPNWVFHDRFDLAAARNGLVERREVTIYEVTVVPED